MGKNNLSLREKVMVFAPAGSGTDGFRLPPSPGKRKKLYLCVLCVSAVRHVLDISLPLYPQIIRLLHRDSP